MITFSTPRLLINELTEADAGFILELLNDADFIANIGDRQVRDLAQARQYLREGPMASYANNGFGMFAVREREQGDSLGVCGLVRRPGLEDIDIGYAFLSASRGRGYALEAARRMMHFATAELQLPRLVAIVNPGNQASITMLETLGLHYEGPVPLSPEEKPISLYAWP